MHPADVEAQRPIVRAILARHFRSVPPHVASFDELEQVGMVGVFEASLRWKPDSAPFSVFAGRRAEGAIRDYLRALRPGTRDFPDAVCIGTDPNVRVPFTSRSVDAPKHGERHLELVDGSRSPEDAVLLREVHDLIDAALDKLPPRTATAVRLVHLQGWTQREAGEFLGVTESRVCQLIKAAFERLTGDAGLVALRAA